MKKTELLPTYVNPLSLTKKQLQVFLTGYCRHRAPYRQHPNCFVTEQSMEPKIGYLDIESTGFQADYHHVLTYCIKTRGKEEYCEGQITQEELQAFLFDKRVMKRLCDDILRYDVILTYYGTKFDVPFMRARALRHNIQFPLFGVVKHKDVYYMVKRLLKLHSNRLESAAQFFGIYQKDHVLGDVWMRARLGDAKALKYVAEHNRKDCIVLEKVHNKLILYDKGLAKSL